jgi:hypothetical protein
VFVPGSGGGYETPFGIGGSRQELQLASNVIGSFGDVAAGLDAEGVVEARDVGEALAAIDREGLWTVLRFERGALLRDDQTEDSIMVFDKHLKRNAQSENESFEVQVL